MYGPRYSKESLLEKIDDEGGLLDAVLAVSADEVPDEITEYWQRLEDVGPIIDLIEFYLYGYQDEDMYEFTLQ